MDQALKLEDSNADILIAMYRSSANDPERRGFVVEAIQQRCRALELLIDDYPYPTDDWDVSQFYNEWAWLVSNTEGDFDKAVRYSLQSLELFQQYIALSGKYRLEDSAGLLDTLARCYYAAGDLDAAIQHQARAVEYQPHMRVMQRQLEMFRSARQAQGG